MPVSDEHKARVLAHLSDQPAVIRATFSEWRMVKGRKVLQIICEVPLEAQDHVWQALGSPQTDTDIWVAIARLRDGNAPQIEAPARTGSLAQQAGILCNEGGFQRYIAEVERLGDPVPADLCANFVRSICGIDSRRELDTNEEAARKFIDLRADYKLWLSGVDPIAHSVEAVA